MARQSITSTTSTVASTDSTGLRNKVHSSWKSATQYISQKAKEHHRGVNEAYRAYYGLNVPTSRRN
ncbi:uncharacterized protein PV07_08912 [Cladophialophora immunda]|uniref:Uncharacterized protein n=1 Tax=Cladophialophora immunda TaxID=569365 RepID=A0A0D2AL64_9EURO|nr:uncharacterized protein PV07_08912 [Cladophialophora immunda]KIW25757.1 hypothetical protein PV07_08912 [Cladophialophora immunda]